MILYLESTTTRPRSHDDINVTAIRQSDIHWKPVVIRAKPDDPDFSFWAADALGLNYPQKTARFYAGNLISWKAILDYVGVPVTLPRDWVPWAVKDIDWSAYDDRRDVFSAKVDLYEAVREVLGDEAAAAQKQALFTKGVKEWRPKT